MWRLKEFRVDRDVMSDYPRQLRRSLLNACHGRHDGGHEVARAGRRRTSLNGIRRTRDVRNSALADVRRLTIGWALNEPDQTFTRRFGRTIATLRDDWRNRRIVGLWPVERNKKLPDTAASDDVVDAEIQENCSVSAFVNLSGFVLLVVSAYCGTFIDTSI